MKLKYLKTSDPGLHWMRAYYRKNRQLNRAKALAAIRMAERNISDFPAFGHVFQEIDGVFECLIQGTTFSLLYTVAQDTVWIIDIRDQRGFRSADALHNFGRELSREHGITWP